MMKPNKFNTFLMLLATTFTSLGVYAQTDTYQFAVTGQYALNQSDDKANSDSKKILGTYYTREVLLDRKSPFVEHSFLQRKTSLSLSYASQNVEDAYFSSQTLPIKGLGFKLYDSDFALQLAGESWHKSQSLKTNAQQSYDQKSTNYYMSYGYFFKKNTLVSLEINRDRRSYSGSTGQVALADVVRKTQGVTLHSVMSFINDQSIVLDLAFRTIKSKRTDSTSMLGNSEVSAQLQYYPKSSYYVMGGFALSRGDDSYTVGKTPSLGVGYAYTPNLSVQTSVRKFYSDDTNKGPNHKSLNAEVTFRF